MTTTTDTRTFGYTVTIEGEQAASGAAEVPSDFDGDLVGLAAGVAWRWLKNDCQIPADGVCPSLTARVVLDGTAAEWSA